MSCLMKNQNLAIILFLFFFTTASAQENKIHSENNSDFFSLDLSIGIIGNISTQNIVYDYNSGFNYNIDVSYTPKSAAGFFVNYSSSNLNGYNENSYPNSKGKIDYTQISLGPRFYSDKRNSFIDAGLGYSNINNDDVIGATIGLGGKFKITDTYAVTLVGRVYAANIFSSPYVNYILSSGFELRSKNKSKDANNGNYQSGKFSVAVLAGMYAKNNYYRGGNTFNTEVSYEFAKKTVFLLSYVYSLYEIDYSGFFNSNNIKYRSAYTGGVRYYLKDDNLKFFAEGLAGAYIIKFRYLNFYADFNSTLYLFGLTFGGGAEFKLVDQLSGILKIDFSNTFNDNFEYKNVAGSYLGFFGGLKYNL